MTGEEKSRSYQEAIPDGTSWEDILFDLRGLTGHYIAHSEGRFGALEAMLVDSSEGDAKRDAMLRIARDGKERSKPLRTYLDRINEYILRLSSKDTAET
jgi:hypothetical protein